MRAIYLIGSDVTEQELLAVPAGAHVAVFNSAYTRFQDAEYLFFQDAHFYDTIRHEDFHKFSGRILSILETDNPRIERLADSDITIGKGKKKFSAVGKNTGFHAICWALNNGYEHVILIGFKCQYNKGDMVMPEVIALWQEQHRQLATVVSCITNLTPNSGIDSYPTQLLGD